jgi:hypothetical protein
VDVLWLADDASRVPQGTVAPGDDTMITTTLGHRFAVVARDGSETILTSEVPIQAIRLGGVPAFYTQHIDVNGFPIVASERVNPYALKEAVYLISLMIAKRPDICEALVKSGARMNILAWNEFTTDQPEFRRFAETPAPGFPGRRREHSRVPGRSLCRRVHSHPRVCPHDPPSRHEQPRPDVRRSCEGGL